jgi:hypothetical protein
MTFFPSISLAKSLIGVLPLAYIGTASSIDVSGSPEVESRRFRLSGKKEGAGAAVAVILDGIMDFE